VINKKQIIYITRVDEEILTVYNDPGVAARMTLDYIYDLEDYSTFTVRKIENELKQNGYIKIETLSKMKIEIDRIELNKDWG
jgi:hypothetical protein